MTHFGPQAEEVMSVRLPGVEAVIRAGVSYLYGTVCVRSREHAAQYH